MQHDTTIPGGRYLVHGAWVNAHGEPIAEPAHHAPHATETHETPESEESTTSEDEAPQKPVQRRTRKAD